MNIGEAISYQGRSQGADPFMSLFRGYQMGSAVKAKRDEAKQKEQEAFDKLANVYPDASKYSSPLYEVAARKAKEFGAEAYKNYSERGKQYLRSPEFYQKKAQLAGELGQLQRQSAEHFQQIKDFNEGKTVYDPNYIKTIQSGNEQDYLGYKNEALGHGVAENYMSNVQGVKPIDYNKMLEGVFADKKKYRERGDKLGTFGSKTVWNTYIPRETLSKDAAEMASDPNTLNFLIATRKDELKGAADEIVKQNAMQGLSTSQKDAYKAAAANIIFQDLWQKRKQYAETVADDAGNKPTDGTEDTDVSEVKPGEVAIFQRTRSNLKGEVNPNAKEAETFSLSSPAQFTIKNAVSSRATTGSVWNIDGTPAKDPGVTQATYSTFSVLPVYKKGEKGYGGVDLTGKVVEPEYLASNKGRYEYKPIAIGAYNDHGETVTIYRPASEVEGAIYDFGTAKQKAARKARVEALNQKAQELNGQTAQTKKQIKKSDIAAKATAAGYSVADYTKLLKEKGIEIID